MVLKNISIVILNLDQFMNYIVFKLKLTKSSIAYGLYIDNKKSYAIMQFFKHKNKKYNFAVIDSLIWTHAPHYNLYATGK